MKIDRLLEIIIYLFNHDNVPASLLAKRFSVSVRTIQRDMVSISAAGIPVYASGGKHGGYSILPHYKLKNSDLRTDEQQMIKKALESLATSYRNDTLDNVIEKYNALIEKEGGQKVFWDFGVSKENAQVQDANALLEKAIESRSFVSFSYRNAKGETSQKQVEPLAIHYKWYAWYLFAYSESSQAYRTFKIARMEHLQIENRKSTHNHGDVKAKMNESEQAYYQTCIPIEIHFHPTSASLIREYFPDCPIETVSENCCRIFLHVPEGERLWKALLLSFGDKAAVVSPASYRDELIKTAKKFLSNYDI